MSRLSLILVLLFSGRVAPAATQLDIADSQFTINGKPTFLLGVSYYGGLGASRRFIEQDLDDMERLGFNWIRVWATWGMFENKISAFDHDGELCQPFFDRLKWLIVECDRRGILVDVTLSRAGRTQTFGGLTTLRAHRRATQLLVSRLKPFRNWYLDLANENDVRRKAVDGSSVSIEELRGLRDVVRQLDPDRLVTCSTTGEFDKQELRDYVLRAGMDFFSPHRRRLTASPGKTAEATRRYLAAMNEFGRLVPVHYQEPFRRGWRPDQWVPTTRDFVTSLEQAINGGAAGWCFHNGDAKTHPEGKPRRSFDLRDQRLFEQLDPQEQKFVEAAAGVLARTRDDRPTAWTEKQSGVDTGSSPKHTFVTSNPSVQDMWPCFSPDSQTLLFTRTTDRKTWNLFTVSVDGGKASPFPKQAPALGTRANWSARHNLIAFNGSPPEGGFDLSLIKGDGSQLRVLQADGIGDRMSYPSWYPGGKSVAVVDFSQDQGSVLKRIDVEKGTVVTLTDLRTHWAGVPRVSPDGNQIVMGGQLRRGQRYSQYQNRIWFLNRDGALRQLDSKRGWAPFWSPDGKWIVFASDRDSDVGLRAIFIASPDGTTTRQLTPFELNAGHPTWSPDGKLIACFAQLSPDKKARGLAVLQVSSTLSATQTE